MLLQQPMSYFFQSIIRIQEVEISSWVTVWQLNHSSEGRFYLILQRQLIGNHFTAATHQPQTQYSLTCTVVCKWSFVFFLVYRCFFFSTTRVPVVLVHAQVLCTHIHTPVHIYLSTHIFFNYLRKPKHTTVQRQISNLLIL